MNSLRLYDDWEDALFLGRPNRFTLLLKKKSMPIKAYLPNTGRLEEFLVEGARFFVAPSPTPRFDYRVVSTLYQGNYVFLDTIRMNSLVHTFIQEHCLEGFEAEEIYREKTLGNIRFDFFITRPGSKPVLLEIKTATLCHNGVALFPDAPSRRAIHHLQTLNRENNDEYSAAMVFMIPNGSAHAFVPNFHTDMDFALSFLASEKLIRKAFSFSLIDPVTVDLKSVREIDIEYEHARQHSRDTGAYLLVLKNKKPRSVDVGRSGRFFFQKGYYVYVGSGMKNLKKRVARHLKKRKRLFWHIDYIAPSMMSVEKIYTIRRNERIESALAERMGRICTAPLQGFGASDVGESSHLFYFESAPYRKRLFFDLFLEFQTLLKSG